MTAELPASGRHQSEQDAGIQISVIVPVLNGEKVIGRCLSALESADFRRDQIEVLVVDNGSTDRTVELALALRPDLNLTVLTRSDVYIGALRNYGAAIAKGRIFAFLDADCLPPPKWLRKGSALLLESGSCVVGGGYALPDSSTWVARAWALQDNCRPEPHPASMVPSGNLWVTSRDFRRLGGFDETLETNEDYDFCRRARLAGLKVMCFPEIAVAHLGSPQTLRAFYRKHRWHGTHVLKVFFRDASSFPNAKAVAYALYIAACVAGLAGGLGAGLIQHRWLWFVLCASATVAAPAVLSFRVAWREKVGRLFLPLSLLYFLYGLARGACLVDPQCWELSRRPAPRIKRGAEGTDSPDAEWRTGA